MKTDDISHVEGLKHPPIAFIRCKTLHFRLDWCISVRRVANFPPAEAPRPAHGLPGAGRKCPTRKKKSATIIPGYCKWPYAPVVLPIDCKTDVYLVLWVLIHKGRKFGAICSCFSLLWGWLMSAEVREKQKIPSKSPPQALIMCISAAFCDLYYTYTPPSSF